MTTDQVKESCAGCRPGLPAGALYRRRASFAARLRGAVSFARRLGMKVLLFTNACLITPHLADLFARIPPLVPIEITVYGMCQESYEAVTRTPGSFAQFRRGVNLLLERNMPFIVKSALLPPNRPRWTNLKRGRRQFRG